MHAKLVFRNYLVLTVVLPCLGAMGVTAQAETLACRFDRPSESEVRKEFSRNQVGIGCTSDLEIYDNRSLVCNSSYQRRVKWLELENEARSRRLSGDELFAIADVIERRVIHRRFECVAADWYAKAAAAGDRRAAYRLGLLLSKEQKRTGLVRDINKAREYFQLSKKLGHPLADRVLRSTADETPSAEARKDKKLSRDLEQALQSSSPDNARLLALEFRKQGSYARKALRRIKSFGVSTAWGGINEIHMVDMFFFGLAGARGDSSAGAKVGLRMIGWSKAPIGEPFSAAIIARAAAKGDAASRHYIRQNSSFDWQVAKSQAENTSMWKKYDGSFEAASVVIAKNWRESAKLPMTERLNRLSILTRKHFESLGSITDEGAGPGTTDVQAAVHASLVAAAKSQNPLYQAMVPGVREAAVCDEVWCVLRNTVKFRWHVPGSSTCRKTRGDTWSCRFKMRQVVRVETGWMGKFGWGRNETPWQQRVLSNINRSGEFDASMELQREGNRLASSFGGHSRRSRDSMVITAPCCTNTLNQ